MREHLLTLVLAIPVLGAVVVAALPSNRLAAIRWTSMGTALAGLLTTVPLCLSFSSDAAGFQLLEEAPWIPDLGVSYRLGIDGIALLLVLLTQLLLPLVLLVSWEGITQRVKSYNACLLVLQVGMLGVFLALDGFLFFVFWEVMLVPMYFLIGIWGADNRLYAAIKFFLYTAAGSVLMLLALIKLALLNGGSFDLRTMPDAAVPGEIQNWLFLALFLGFAIKVPMFPFHTWLPDAHGQAPTAGSVLLAGVLLKMGTYGFVRIAIPVLPEAAMAWMPFLVALCVVGIIFGALAAMAQTDMKQLVAYSSVSHLGFVMLGVFTLNPTGMAGGLLQMINHGISTGALFLLVGMLYERRHTKLISEFGGLARPMPVFAAIFVIITMSSIGLPGLNGFVGEFPILAGAVELAAEDWTWMVAVVLAGSGVVLGAAYMLWLVRRVLFGPVTHGENASLPDLRPTGAEFWAVAPLVVACFVIGLRPAPFFRVLEKPVRQLVEAARPGYFEGDAVADVLPTASVTGGGHGAGEAGGGHH